MSKDKKQDVAKDAANKMKHGAAEAVDGGVAAGKSFLEAQIDACAVMTGIALEETGKIVELNMATVKHSVDDSVAATRELLAAKDPQAFVAAVTESTQPGVEHIAAYGRDLSNIVSAMNAELIDAADTQVAKVDGKLKDTVDVIAGHAPESAASAVAMMKSSVAKGKEGYQKVSGAARKAVDMSHKHVAKVSGKVIDAVKKMPH